MFLLLSELDSRYMYDLHSGHLYFCLHWYTAPLKVNESLCYSL